MYKIDDPWSKHVSIVVETDTDKQTCKRALGAAQAEFPVVMAIDRIDTPSSVEVRLSEKIVRGLVDISLGAYGERGFSGLRQTQARDLVGDLSGSVEDFFYPILAAAKRA